MPVFIGNFRSGTTLLINLLGLHPKVTAWFETKGLCEPLRWLRVLEHPETRTEESRRVRPDRIPGFSTRKIADRMRADFEETILKMAGRIDHGKGLHEHYPIGADQILSSLDQCLTRVDDWALTLGESPSPGEIKLETGRLIQSLGADECLASGKPQWINKTPEITRFGSELQCCLGAIKIILVIRDGRHVVRSAAKLGWASEEELSIWWKNMILESRRSAEAFPQDYLEIRYEDLLQAPLATLKAVLGFLELDGGNAEALIEAYNSRIAPEGRRLGADAFLERPGGCSDEPAKVQGLDLDFLESLGYR